MNTTSANIIVIDIFMSVSIMADYAALNLLFDVFSTSET
ncbi:hypothetical protein ADICYQ_4382 [Cyclobacterium qasimii M12-11B]|uniref:Uncharacterized protein n=1 Tax=Cyclobacterium qasimii M12-11B TaxID=641524 RepID=S7V8N5_9BACT|nr:hypothetical protein ADICYQ_4382 [Cyclobacterium qasimii M12-11B]